LLFADEEELGFSVCPYEEGPEVTFAAGLAVIVTC